jgi:hypothetical protein
MRTVALALVLLRACEPLPQAPPTPSEPPAFPNRPVTVPPEHPSSGPLVSSKPAPLPGAVPSRGFQVSVEHATGIEPRALAQALGQAEAALAHCPQPGGGTTLHVSLVKKGTSVHFHVEPGSTLDPTAHDCVLESLSTIDIPQTGDNLGGPTVPPSGFTSLFTLTW